MGDQPRYFTAFSTLDLSRTRSGVLTMRFHTDGGPASFSGPMQQEMPLALAEIGADSDNRVLVLTGTGDTFMDGIDRETLGDLTRPEVWNQIYTRGTTTMQRFVDLPMPIVAAVNGAASVHSEWALLADIVIASESTVFSDYSHPAFGTVPGDGVHAVWESVLGLNRSRHFALTGESFTAAQAKEWGVVAEVVATGDVLPRAYEVAETMAARSPLLLHFQAVTLRQRLSRDVAAGTAVGMGVEGLAATAKAYEN